MLAIICDSTCDIPQPLIEEYDIYVVPQYVIWGEEQYRDRVDIQPQEFYQRLVSDRVRPTTSQATLGDFKELIDHVVEKGASEAIILTVSSAMSGTYEMAKRAADAALIPVSVIDSKGPTMTLGWQVLAAARARDEGASRDEIIQKVAEVREKMVQVVAMQSLDYLQRGGRIGDAAKWVGTLLKVKPVVTINHETGRVEPAGLARTYNSMVKMLYKKFFEGIEAGKKLHIAVLHGDAPEEAQKLAEQIKEEFDPVELIINITGPVLGINTGPGALALCGYTEG
ncbi:MAG: DegV family protein [Brevefilum sp.]|nr:DegV family protein [Brevefilum sp.]MDW7755466.1 DegV family protein [Brevefilum sp.]